MLIGPALAWGQTVTVLDADSGLPLAGATLTSETPQAYAVTNAKGQANLSAFPDSEAIQIRSLGYATRVMRYRELEASGFEVSLGL